MEIFTYIFTIVISFITINSVIFKFVDDRTKYKGEITNMIFFSIIILGIFIFIYDKPFKLYRKRIYYEELLVRYEWLKKESFAKRYIDEYKINIQNIKRKLVLMKLTRGKKLH